MAKSKRSAALFEVIQSSRIKKPGRLIRTSRWWFRRSAQNTNPLQSALITSPEETLPQTIAHSAPAPVSTVVETPRPPKQPIPGIDLQLDPDRQLVTFKLSYNSALVTAFTILVAIGLAYIVGRKTNRVHLAATSSPSTADLRAQPVHPEVLDVGSENVVKQTELLTHSPDNHAADNAQLAALKTPTTSPSSVDSQRIIGRQYVVIQIYPEKKNADDAAALLNKNNIPCTVENGLVGWASKSWWCVVGTTGFDHIRGNSEYERYEAAVNRVSDQFAANSKFKKFEPRAYRWKESNT